VSAFCQGFTSLSEIERHTFVLVRRLSLFHLGAVAIFWPMSLVGIYPGRASFRRLLVSHYLHASGKPLYKGHAFNLQAALATT